LETELFDFTDVSSVSQTMFFHQFVASWINLHEFTFYKRVKIVGAKKCLGGFGEILCIVGEGIVLTVSAIDIKDLVIVALFYFGLPGASNGSVANLNPTKNPPIVAF
jgi:hypothetical protein